ncbi:MAG TPA: hypothetical protein VM889_10825 [Candidatus Thermoplasmatota archaeon]|nr:hypothetical protein [Candidatus Thermoplasmatota archaeon]
MIGAFAKMLGDRDRVLEVAAEENGSQVKLTSRGDGTGQVTSVSDAPPAAFVEKMAYDGGDVYVVPFLEAFRSWLRRKPRA